MSHTDRLMCANNYSWTSKCSRDARTQVALGRTADIIHCWMLFTVLFCPKLPPITHGFVDSQETIFGTQVNASCRTGYLFPDGNSSKALACIDNQRQATWNDSVTNCTGSQQFTNKIITLPYLTLLAGMCCKTWPCSFSGDMWTMNRSLADLYWPVWLLLPP